MSKREPHLYLQDILESIQAIESYVEGMPYEKFAQDRKTYSATIRELQIIGEAVTHLFDFLTTQDSDAVWQYIRAFRNRIIHEYFGIDLRIVWDVVKNELPSLKAKIESIREKFFPRSNL